MLAGRFGVDWHRAGRIGRPGAPAPVGIMPSSHAPADRPSFRARIADGKLRQLCDFWLSRRGDRIAMLRADLDPTEIPQLLANLILADVGEGGRAIRYRLVGTAIVAAHGVDYTGRTIEELTSGETLEFTRRLYGRVVADAVPVYSEGQFRWAGREYRRTRRLHLPLTRDGGAVDMVLSGQVFEEGAGDGPEMLVAATAEELDEDRR